MLVIFGIRSRSHNLLPNRAFQPLNDATNTFRRQSDGGQGCYLLGAHALPEIEPENHAVTLAIGACQDPLQPIIDLTQDNCESDFFLAPTRFLARFWIDITSGNMRLVAPRALTMAILK